MDRRDRLDSQLADLGKEHDALEEKLAALGTRLRVKGQERQAAHSELDALFARQREESELGGSLGPGACGAGARDTAAAREFFEGVFGRYGLDPRAGLGDALGALRREWEAHGGPETRVEARLVHDGYDSGDDTLPMRSDHPGGHGRVPSPATPVTPQRAPMQVPMETFAIHSPLVVHTSTESLDGSLRSRSSRRGSPGEAATVVHALGERVPRAAAGAE